MTILVLVDGSGWSFKAAMMAMDIARRNGDDITLFSVLDRGEARAMAYNICSRSGVCTLLPQQEDTVWREMHRGMREELQNLLLVLTREGVSCTIQMREGDLKEEVVREAESGAYSLIVMGSYGRMGRSHQGSLPSRIGGAVSPPVLIVK
jgi:nucleotide-binding universal stress UspA family protein